MIFGLEKAPLRSSPQSRFDETELIKLGNAEIDEQHHRMFLLADAIVESLVNAGADGTGSDPLDLLQTFIDFSYQHFRFEEDLMRSVDYPGTEAHAEEHSALLTEIGGHRYRFELGHSNVAQITVYLRDWINRHIDHKDRELVDWLKAEAKLTTATEKRNEVIAAPDELKVFESNALAEENTKTVINRLGGASKRETTASPSPRTLGAHVVHDKDKGSQDQSGQRKPIRQFDIGVSARKLNPRRALTRSPLLRQTIGLLSLTLAYLQYYYLEVQLQIMSLPSVITLPVITLPFR